MDYLKTQAPFWKKEAGPGRRALGRRAGRRRRRAGALGHRRRTTPAATAGQALSVPWAEIGAVSAGAVVGSLLRWAAGLWLNARWSGFPLGTLFVNCVGGLLIGALLFWLERSPNELLRLLLVTGLLGGFTTFSAFSVESLIMLQRGELLLAFGPHAGPRRRCARLRGARLPARAGALVAG